MEQLCRRTEDLIDSWQRHDWRESFFAPGLVILQALTRDGRTASGAGWTRDDAFDRCLGETAEIHALADWRRRGGAFDPWRDGVAAHPDPALACEAARNEACERAAVADWWLGHEPAAPVSEAWIAQAGLAAQLEAMRRGAALRRRTDWWQIRSSCEPCVMVCRSMSLEGQDPVLGFGCHDDPVAAADKALRELLLMELNLMELLAARSTGEEAALEPVRARIRGYALQAPRLFPDAAEELPAAPCALVLEFRPRPECREISCRRAPVSVWICQPGTPSPLFTKETGLPYL
ncbi:YcaO-like family protein [Paracoccus binzhouensis]|uniref:YcaO-like family protein n=1 Tax=Paracoccus binzhouensis TaxID=2796149 RepID=UPI0018EEE2C6|nr:YcaO-like family protein [Paracoccus binzhouensis]